MEKATLQSQIGNRASCRKLSLPPDADYQSLVDEGNRLAGSYFFREAADAYDRASRLDDGDPLLHMRLGGSYLTVGEYDKAYSEYSRCLELSPDIGKIAMPLGIWHYFRKEWKKASDMFEKAIPCDDPDLASVLYWNALSSLRGGFEDRLIFNLREGMEVGHHISYIHVLEVLNGSLTLDQLWEEVENTEEELDKVIMLYGSYVILESDGMKDLADAVADRILLCDSVWPCIPYLALYHDING